MENFLSAFLQQGITFFAIMDPIGISAVALSLLSPSITKKQIRRVAFKSTMTIVIAFFVVLFTGDFILKLFGIGENSLKVMGGLILLLMAISMVNGSATAPASDEQKDEIKAHEDLSVIPIGIPVAFGTGLFTTIIIFKHQAEGFADLISISLAYLINALIFYIILRNSIYIRKYLGLTGQNIITKVMGLIVGAIAVQFIVSGIVALAKSYM